MIFEKLICANHNGRPYYEIQYIENGERHIGYSSYNLDVISEYLTNYFMSDEIKVPNSNSDNIENAVKGLDVFCHNFCMDCEETEKENDLVFRCDECCFKMADGRCLVKIFKNTFLPEYKNFGCMGDR